jgi:hypothetical protein
MKRCVKITRTIDFVTVADSWVKKNKLKETTGHGEAKLMIGSDPMPYEFFRSNTARCYFDRDSIFEYFFEVKYVYIKNYHLFRRGVDMMEDWANYFNEFKQFNSKDFFFNIFIPKITKKHVYINSKDEIYEFIRRIAIPIKSFFKIEEIIEEDGQYLYRFLIKFDLSKDDIDSDNELLNKLMKEDSTELGESIKHHENNNVDIDKIELQIEFEKDMYYEIDEIRKKLDLRIQDLLLRIIKENYTQYHPFCFMCKKLRSTQYVVCNFCSRKVDCGYVRYEVSSPYPDYYLDVETVCILCFDSEFGIDIDDEILFDKEYIKKLAYDFVDLISDNSAQYRILEAKSVLD